MPREKPELNDAMRKKMAGKPPEKTLLKVQSLQLLFQAQKAV